ncbi:hypothetical protein RJ639_032800 [Escallonia herrerae]|uniref:Uncharacterized protein n=1 Tax=Escallonia herrerae TaxID=1293975 RepID=A0AA88X8V4_9ASTE|nr:hypothetical protein RJ639_032800 [Escallonia herrerae]
MVSGHGTLPLTTTIFMLEPGESASLLIPPSWSGQLWARTLCSYGLTGRFNCLTGDYGSGQVWVYLMKQKSEVFSVFKQWKLRVENQTGKKLKYFRSDNDMEYKDEEFLQFRKDEGIIRHFSSKSRILHLKKLLSRNFDMNDLDSAMKILDMEIHRDQKAGKLWVTQKRVQEWINSRQIVVHKVHTNDNATNMRTTTVVTEKFKHCLSFIFFLVEFEVECIYTFKRDARWSI